MSRLRSVRGLRAAVWTGSVPRPVGRYDGYSAVQNNGSSGAVSGGGTAPASPPAGGAGVAAPPASPPPAPAGQPGGQGQPTTAPSVGSGGVGQPGGQPQPGVQGPPAGTPGAPAAGQPANPWASLNPQQQAYIQGLQRQAQEWERNRHFAVLGHQQWAAAQGQGGNRGAGGGQGQPAAPPPGPANPFGVPAFDLRNLSLIRRTADGGVEVDPYAPPGLLGQAQEYQAKLAEATHNFFQDPEKYLGEIVKKIAGQVAQQTHQQQFGQVQQQQFAQQTLQQNAEWLYDRDAAGNTVQSWNPQTGQYQPQLSAWGQEYKRKVVELHHAGVTDGRQQHAIAVQHLQNLAYQQMFRGQQGQAAGAAQQQQFLTGAPGVQTPPPPVQPPGQQPPGPNAGASRQTLREMLNADWHANGFNDANIHQHVMQGVGAGGGA